MKAAHALPILRRTLRNCGRLPLLAVVAVVGIVALDPSALRAQFGQEPGHSIGSVTRRGNLILLTLNEGALGHAQMFNLAHRTLRFTPDAGGYRVQNVPVVWDADFGSPLTAPQVNLKNFAFPFSGKTWSSLSVGMTGSIVFGDGESGGAPAERRGVTTGREGGLSVDRFAELKDAAAEIINTVPALSVFFKPRMSGTRYLKELDDRAVITWTLTEPYAGIQDWTWKPTINRFQAVLYKNGTIEFSYDDMAARDAVVGVYPLVPAGDEKTIDTIQLAGDSSAAPNLDIRRIKLGSLNNMYLDVALQSRGPMLAATDAAIAGLSYVVCIDKQMPKARCEPGAHADVVWTVRGFGERTHGTFHSGPRYFGFGSGLSPHVNVDGNSISFRGTLPEGYKAGDQVYVSGSVQAPGAHESIPIPPHAVRLASIASPSVDFSALPTSAGPYPIVYEAFHYMKPPRAQDLTCSVIQALGDKYDMLAYYSDFRIDNPEAGTSSDGPLGGGPNGGAVTGIAAEQGNLADYCTKGRFQWQFIQPVYVGANQMQKYPPADLKDTNTHNIGGYLHQLAERTSDGKIPPYDYAMSQIGHEMGHRWSAFVSAKVNGEVIELGPTHWAMGLQAPVPFPYQRPTEASAMGGGVWQDNFDGTYTQLDDNYYVPATGFSYLDLYLMGFISAAEVPDFFMLKSLVPAGKDANGHTIFKADRTKLTIQDVIANEGPRLPDVDHAQKNFNTGMVMVVEHGKTPSPELIERTSGIRERWMDYWSTVTGHRSTMTANP
ncbi:MAG TPA: hypothetical protein VHZ25_16435 [Acidobacteriaceae bacterium]|jgi:hypothetical protein|nr:hypothetical protein [Acidobacteriaceae bacterium]